MSSIDSRQSPGAAPPALDAASGSARPSSSERDEAGTGSGPRVQDHDWSWAYSAGDGPQYGGPDGCGRFEYGEPDGYGRFQYGGPDGYGRFQYGQGGYLQPPRQLLIVVVLALFAGLFGLHNFYLGHTHRGLTQLLVTVCTLGIAAPFVWIWAVVELILIVTRSGSYAFDAFGRPLV